MAAVFSLYTSTTEIYTLSLHDALPISLFSFWFRSASLGWVLPPVFLESLSRKLWAAHKLCQLRPKSWILQRSEEHTSELQSRFDLVCRLLLEKKKDMDECIRPMRLGRS